MEAEAAGGGERWAASTNWIISGGSIRDVISFETSEEDAPALTSFPLLLLPPPAAEHEFLPCEVTFRLSGKHELHRIYVRSTARVYEIYYAADKQNNYTEYLCTVRCSITAKEATSVSSVVSADSENGSYATLEKQDKISVADSNCSTEDGWVEVVSDSPSHDYKINATSREEDRNSNPDFQVYYEATADISDLSPCMSVTLRFLSLQTKTCVRISEIYVCADPVEIPSPDNSVAMGEKYGGSSLLAMFMPSLLQLSKSTASMQEKKLSDISGAHKYQDGVQKQAEISSSGMKITLADEESSDKKDLLPGLGFGQNQLKPECRSSGWNQSECDQVSDSCLADRKLDQVHEQIKAERMWLGSSQKITEEASSSKTAQEELEHVPLTYSKEQSAPDKISTFCTREKYVAVDHIDRVLNELVSRVTRIETFCSRFEESLLKPLNSIDVRLQKLESVLDKFAEGDQLRPPGGYSKVSGSHISADRSDSENKDIMHSSSTLRDDSPLPADVKNTECPSLAAGVTTSVPESRTYQGFVMKAPEFISDDSSLPADVMGCPSLATGVTTSVPESCACQGFVMKAPESISEDDECIKNDCLISETSYRSKKLSDIENEDDVCIRNDSSLASDVNSLEDKKVSSIDSALASALEAFLISNPRPNVMIPCAIPTGDESSLNSSVDGVMCNETDSCVEASNEVQEETSISNSPLSAAAASKSCVRNYGKDSCCGISSILASDDSSTPLDTFFSSLTCDRNYDKDSVCGISGILEVSAALDDSSKPFNTLISTLCSSLMDSELRLKPPDFPSIGDERDGCGDTGHKDQACMAMNGDGAPTRSDKHCSSMEVLHEGSDDSPHDCCPENREDGMKLHQCCSTSAVTRDEILIVEGMFCSFSSGLHDNGNKETQICLVNDSDHNEEEFDDPVFSQFDKRWSRSDFTGVRSVQTGIASGSSDVVMTSHTANQNNTAITNICDKFLGLKIEQTPKSATCSDDNLWDVKFVRQEDWTTGVPLETLLGETCDDGDQANWKVTDEVNSGDEQNQKETDGLNAGDELLEGMQSSALPADNFDSRNDVGES